MPKINGSSVADKTRQADSRVEVPPPSIQDANPNEEYLEDGHPNPKAWKIWDFMQELAEKDLWQEYIGYLYRVFPKHAPTDHPAYIACIINPLTQEMVKQLYGGKKYSLILNRRVGTRQRQVYKEQFDIDAPVIWQDGEVPADGSVPLQRGQRGAPGAALGEAPTGERDKMLNRLLDDLIEQRNHANEEGVAFDPGETLGKAIDLLGTAYRGSIESITANSGKGDSAVVTVLGNMLTEMMKSNNSRKEDPVMQMLLERALEKPEDPIGKITGLLTLLKELGVKIGPGRATAEGGGSEWAGVVEKLVDKAPELLSRAAALAPQRAPVPVRMNPAITARTTAPVTAAAPAATMSAADVAADPAPGNLSTAAISEEELTERVAQNVVKATIVRMLFAGDSGDDAAHYAEMAHEPLAKTLAQLLKGGDYTEFEKDPILKQTLTHVNVMTFAKEFVDYFEEEDHSRSPETVAAAPPATWAPPAGTVLQSSSSADPSSNI